MEFALQWADIRNELCDQAGIVRSGALLALRPSRSECVPGFVARSPLRPPAQKEWRPCRRGRSVPSTAGRVDANWKGSEYFLAWSDRSTTDLVGILYQPMAIAGLPVIEHEAYGSRQPIWLKDYNVLQERIVLVVN